MNPGPPALLGPYISREVNLTASLNGSILEVNAAGLRLLGWSTQELQARSFLDLVHADDRQQTSDALALSSAECRPVDLVNRCLHKDTTHSLISWRAMVDKDVLYTSGLEMEANPKTSEALFEAQEALRQMQKMEALGQLTGSIAHDLNNHLQNVVAALELTRRMIASGRSAETERFIKNAIAAAQNAATLTQRVRGFARRHALRPESLAMGDVIAAMDDLMRRSLPQSIRLDVDVAADLENCTCDRNEAEAAILHLLLNACDAMPDGGIIVLRGKNVAAIDAGNDTERNRRSGPHICLELIDCGRGMTSTVVAHAFDAFYTTKPAGLGAGLGLTMVQRFVQRNDGALKITSEPGKGTTVAIYLPADAPLSCAPL